MHKSKIEFQNKTQMLTRQQYLRRNHHPLDFSIPSSQRPPSRIKFMDNPELHRAFSRWDMRMPATDLRVLERLQERSDWRYRDGPVCANETEPAPGG